MGVQDAGFKHTFLSMEAWTTCTYRLQVASLASATFVCTLGREQQFFPNDQLSAAAWLAPPSWPRHWLAAESLLLPKTP